MKRKIDRQDILDAGYNLMFTNGYEATGIKEITDEVKIPKGSFYNHFSSKEEFGLEVLQQYADNGELVHKKNFLDKNFKPLERIERFYDQSIKLYEKSGFDKGCMMSNFSVEMGDVNENFRELLDREFQVQESYIIKCIEEGQEDSSIRNDIEAQTLGSFVINSWHGSLVRMKSTASGKPLEDFLSMILTFLKK